MIVTNAHVAGQGRIQVELDDGTEVPARVLAVDPDHDLVALSVEADDLPAIELGDSAWLQPGDWVLALGHPWGVPGAATTGTVIGTDDDLPEMSRGRREWIAVGMRLRPGNSGGPLVDSRGQACGHQHDDHGTQRRNGRTR